MLRLRWIFLAACTALLFLTTVTVCVFEYRNIVRLKRDIRSHSGLLRKKELSVTLNREKVSFYKTPDGIAHRMREKHKMIRPGERIFLISADAPVE